jgi:hypothetical protein
MYQAVALMMYLPITYLNYLAPARTRVAPRSGKRMSEKMKPLWRVTALYGIVPGLVLMLPACADFKKDFLCRPNGICVNATAGHTGIN